MLNTNKKKNSPNIIDVDINFALNSTSINRFLVFKGKKKYNSIIKNIIVDYDNGNLKKQFKDFYYSSESVNYVSVELCHKKAVLSMENNEISLIGVGGFGQVYKISDSACLKINLTKDKDYHEFEIPRKLDQILDEKMKKLILLPTTLIKDCKFLGLINVLQINIFFIYITHCFFNNKPLNKREIEKKIKEYNIQGEYEELFSKKNPKIEQIDKFTKFYNFLCNTYIKETENMNILKYIISLISSFKPQTKKKRKNKNKENYIDTKDTTIDVKKEGFMILMPLMKCNSNSLTLNLSTKRIDLSCNGVKAYKVFPRIHRVLFLQMGLLLLNINKSNTFIHNDLKPDNILVDSISSPYDLSYNDLSFMFSEPFIFKLADFDFSLLTNIKNNKIADSKLITIASWFTDIHYLVHNMFFFISFEEYNNDLYFFDSLHKKFIEPYCNVNIETLLTDHDILIKDKNTYCSNGRYMSNVNVDISILYDFISSELFEPWRIKKNKKIKC